MKRLILLTLTMCILYANAQNIPLQNASFEAFDGWNVVEGEAYLQNGKGFVSQGEPTRLVQYVQVEKGVYDLTAKLSISSCNGRCFLYGKGVGFSIASTEVPKVRNLQNESVTVFVRGIESETGQLEIGLFNEGLHDVIIDDVVLTKSDKPYTFLQGGDVTELNYVLDMGGNYFDTDGEMLYNQAAERTVKAQKVMDYLAQSGMNFVRIRNSNNPGKSNTDTKNQYYLPDGYQNTEDCLALAIAAKNADMKIQYTFNYSDYWSNGEQQNIPADWLDSIKGVRDNWEIVQKLSSCVYHYTYKVMKELAENGIFPEFVSLGNETNGGLLFPYGYSYDVTWDDDNRPKGKENWDAIVAFYNAGYDAVKAISPSSKVIIHLADNTGDYDKYGANVNSYTYAWYFDNLKKRGAKYDVMGASYYPAWSGATVSDLVEYCENLMSRYGKDMVIMESGYNFHPTRKDGWNGQLSDNAAEYDGFYDFSEEGQKSFVTELLNALQGVRSTSGNECLGSLYWDPMMIHVEDEHGGNKTGWAHRVSDGRADVNVVENTTLFDFDGVALSAFEAYEGNRYAQPNNTTSTVRTLSTPTLKIYSHPDGCLLQSDVDQTIRIYQTNGMLAKILDMKAHETVVITLKKGVYLVNGTKVVVE
jgi:arabinogalactan endo-1,4-beta-galactosidase